MGLNFVFWFSVFTFWLFVRGSESVGLLFCTLFLIAMGTISISLFFGLPVYQWFSTSLGRVVRKHRRTAWKRWKERKTKSAQIDWKQAEALRIIKLQYGPSLFVEAEFTMDYFHTLVVRTFDCILVFDTY